VPREQVELVKSPVRSENARLFAARVNRLRMKGIIGIMHAGMQERIEPCAYLAFETLQLLEYTQISETKNRRID